MVHTLLFDSRDSQTLSRHQLKIYAMISMFIDHFCNVFHFYLPQIVWYVGRNIIGRIACPIFCVLFVQGMMHTRKPIKHLIVLAIFAVLSEPGFDKMCAMTWFSFSYQSVMLSWLLCGGMIVIFRLLEEYTEDRYLTSWMYYGLMVVTAIVFMVAAHKLNVDYDFEIVVACVAAYVVWHKWPDMQAWVVCVLIALIEYIFYGQWGIFLAVPFMFFYDSNVRQETTVMQKYSFYVFYPAHLVALCLAEEFISKFLFK